MIDALNGCASEGQSCTSDDGEPFAAFATRFHTSLNTSLRTAWTNKGLEHDHESCSCRASNAHAPSTTTSPTLPLTDTPPVPLLSLPLPLPRPSSDKSTGDTLLEDSMPPSTASKLPQTPQTPPTAPHSGITNTTQAAVAATSVGQANRTSGASVSGDVANVSTQLNTSATNVGGASLGTARHEDITTSPAHIKAHGDYVRNANEAHGLLSTCSVVVGLHPDQVRKGASCRPTKRWSVAWTLYLSCILRKAFGSSLGTWAHGARL